MAKSLKAANAALVAQLDSLGSKQSDFDLGNELSVIESKIGEFIERVHQNLTSENMMVSGKIADITIEKIDGGVSVSAHPWLFYQDKGVNGVNNKSYNSNPGYTTTRPPVQPFIDYIKAKNIQLRNNKKYYGKGSPYKELTEEQKISSAAYAMRENVYKNGIKPRNVYSKEIPKLADDIADGLADFLANEIVK